MSNLKKHLDCCHANTKRIVRHALGEKRRNKTRKTIRHVMVLEVSKMRRLVAEYIVENMYALSTLSWQHSESLSTKSY